MDPLRRTAHTYRTGRGEEVTVFNWREVGRWTFRPNSGTFWEEYLVKKEAHMRAVAMSHTEEKNPLGIDYDKILAGFKRVKEKMDSKTSLADIRSADVSIPDA